jgi:hypothetical protein
LLFFKLAVTGCLARVAFGTSAFGEAPNEPMSPNAPYLWLGARVSTDPESATSSPSPIANQVPHRSASTWAALPHKSDTLMLRYWYQVHNARRETTTVNALFHWLTFCQLSLTKVSIDSILESKVPIDRAEIFF